MVKKARTRMRTIASVRVPRMGRTRRMIGLYQRKTSTGIKGHGRGWFGEPGRHARAARIAARTRYHHMLERIGIENAEENAFSKQRGQDWMNTDEQRLRKSREREENV